MTIEKCQDTILFDITNLYLIPNQAKDRFVFYSRPLVYNEESMNSLTKVPVTHITNSESICSSKNVPQYKDYSIPTSVCPCIPEHCLAVSGRVTDKLLSRVTVQGEWECDFGTVLLYTYFSSEVWSVSLLVFLMIALFFFLLTDVYLKSVLTRFSYFWNYRIISC